MSLLFLSGCSDYLDVTPIDNLAGNNFWQTEEDVESFTLSIYNQFRSATMMNKPLIVASGDLRGAPISSPILNYVNPLRNNNLGDVITYNNENLDQITYWQNFYEVIQLANILYVQIEELPEGVLSENDVLTYRAEAVFMRNLSYFFLVRLYGDVPYYTEAFHEEALPRMDMVEVLNNGLEELESIKDNLPWTYENTAFKSVRANRAAVLALMMHMNMWATGFDQANQENYYQRTVELGEELMEENGGDYGLVPLEETSEIFSGGSREGIFEIVQNVNAGEQFPVRSVYSNYVTAIPYTSNISPLISYQLEFIRRIYPATTTDGRKTTWYTDLYTTDGSQQMVKFLNPFQESGVQLSNVGNQIVFRYTELVLLRAEALANLGMEEQALEMVNMIRNRAGADPFNSFGQALEDDIYWERVRELMGEGYYFFDLVRTGKIVDGTYSFAPISRTAFNQGAWTWPINESALEDNPFIQLNNYWN